MKAIYMFMGYLQSHCARTGFEDRYWDTVRLYSSDEVTTYHPRPWTSDVKALATQAARQGAGALLPIRCRSTCNSRGSCIMKYLIPLITFSFLASCEDNTLLAPKAIIVPVETEAVAHDHKLTNDHIDVTVKTLGGTMCTHYKVTIIDATSITITAIDTSGATVTTDTSDGTWAIVTGRL